jgi:hypothetical protein
VWDLTFVDVVLYLLKKEQKTPYRKMEKKIITTEIYKGTNYYGVVIKENGEYLTTLSFKTRKLARKVADSNDLIERYMKMSRVK